MRDQVRTDFSALTDEIAHCAVREAYRIDDAGIFSSAAAFPGGRLYVDSVVYGISKFIIYMNIPIWIYLFDAMAKVSQNDVVAIPLDAHFDGGCPVPIRLLFLARLEITFPRSRKCVQAERSHLLQNLHDFTFLKRGDSLKARSNGCFVHHCQRVFHA